MLSACSHLRDRPVVISSVDVRILVSGFSSIVSNFLMQLSRHLMLFSVMCVIFMVLTTVRIYFGCRVIECFLIAFYAGDLAVSVFLSNGGEALYIRDKRCPFKISFVGLHAYVNFVSSVGTTPF